MKRINDISMKFSCLSSREMTLALHRENALQLSDDENEEDEERQDDDDDHITRNSTTVLTEITDNKTNRNSINQQNSNDNPLPPPHAYENQT